MPPSKKIKVTRNPKRGHYDRETVNRILDANFLCHAGFVHDGYPVVIPTLYGRDGDTVYLHGSSASRMMKDLRAGIEVCLTVTQVHGLVLARSAYHHSMNYESVVLFGRAHTVDGDTEKVRALKVISDHLLAGRWEDVRPPNDLELRATAVLALPIGEASAKIRTGPPVDEEEDYALYTWAGVLPLETRYGVPQPDPRLNDSISLPPYLARRE